MTYAQALSRFGRAFVRRMIARGCWQRPAPNVYVAHNGTLTEHERDAVALLSAGSNAALAGLSALRYAGLKGLDDPRPTVVMRIGSKPPPYDDVTPHWSKYLEDVDVHPLHQPRRTRAARSIVDAAAWARSDDSARRIVISAVQQGISTTRLLREALLRRGTCKRRALISQSILDAYGGIQSLPERDFDRICRSRGLPKPSRQTPCRRKDGRYYLDVEWVEYGVAAEIHGIPHLAVAQWDADLDRANEVVINNLRLIIFSSFGIRQRPDRVGSVIKSYGR